MMNKIFGIAMLICDTLSLSSVPEDVYKLRSSHSIHVMKGTLGRC